MNNKNFKVLVAFIFCLFITAIHVTPCFCLPDEEAWYYRTDTHTVNGVTAYRLANAPSSTGKTDTVTIDGAYWTCYGVRIWVVDVNGETEELTDGEPVAVVYRSDTSQGLQSATWNCSGYDGIVNALMIKVYQRFGTQEWSLRVTFITENETLIKLPEATWTFHYYTRRVYIDYDTISTFYWGADWGSSVEIQYNKPSIYEVMLWKLQKGDILGFIMLPYSWFLGFTAYGIVFLLPLAIVLYNRLESATATIIALLLIGGATGGLIGVFVPASGLNLCWILFVLGIAALLYRLIKG